MNSACCLGCWTKPWISAFRPLHCCQQPWKSHHRTEAKLSQKTKNPPKRAFSFRCFDMFWHFYPTFFDLFASGLCRLNESHVIGGAKQSYGFNITEAHQSTFQIALQKPQRGDATRVLVHVRSAKCLWFPMAYIGCFITTTSQIRKWRRSKHVQMTHAWKVCVWCSQGHCSPSNLETSGTFARWESNCKVPQVECSKSFC